MKEKSTIKDYIRGILNACGFAVLATSDDGQPHTSLIAITPLKNFRQLVFATYRNTLKYRNLIKNSKVAILIQGRDVDLKDPDKRTVVTIIGQTEEISMAENEAAYQAHLDRHPEMESFMLSPDCALSMVIAQSYQIVFSIDDIRWITADDLDFK